MMPRFDDRAGRWLLLVLSAVAFAAAPLAAAEPTPSEDADAVERIDPHGVPGTIVLAGGEDAVPTAAALFMQQAGPEEAAQIVLLAEQKESTVRSWLRRGARTVVAFQLKSRGSAENKEIVAAIRQAGGVWIGDGSARALSDRYADTPVATELRRLLERGGVVGGVGAGAELLGSTLRTGDENDESAAGLGLIPDAEIRTGTVKDHNDALTVSPGHVGFGIPADTVMIVGPAPEMLDPLNRRAYGNGNLDRGRTVYVVGDSSVTVRLAASENRPAGQRTIEPRRVADLIALRRAARERAGDDFPPQSVGVPEVPQGTLVIVGGGGMPADVVGAMVAAAGGADARVVVLPTAMPDGSARSDSAPSFFTRAGLSSVTVLPHRGPEEVGSPEFLEAIAEADLLWFGGGRQWRFIDAYEGTPAEEAFHDVLRRGGVIAGSSAGATIQGEYLARANPLGNREIIAEGYERGFAFLPGVAIDQHFTQRRRQDDLRELVTTYPQFLGIGIDEATAIVVTGHTARVIGNDAVHFFDASEGGQIRIKSLPSGGVYDLRARRIIEYLAPAPYGPSDE